MRGRAYPWALAALIASAPTNALANEPPTDEPNVHDVLFLVRDALDWPDATDPDAPMFRWDVAGGRQRAMMGGRLGLYRYRHEDLSVALTLDGFVELVNFDAANPVPWESYRANVGLSSLWGSESLSRALLPEGGRLVAELGFFHESDHAANLVAFETLFLAPSVGLDVDRIRTFDNANFSSFEYVALSLGYEQTLDRLMTYARLGFRGFPPPINPSSARELRYGVELELRARLHLWGVFHAAAGLYLESIANDFDARAAGLDFDHAGQDYRYRRLQVGLDVDGGAEALSLYFLYSRSNGRGIDFVRRYGDELGGGVAFRF